MSTSAKQKIHKTNRIVVKLPNIPRGVPIYCSSKIAGDDELKEHIVRLNQRLFPRKDHNEAAVNRLKVLAKKFPEHFPYTSKVMLGVEA